MTTRWTNARWGAPVGRFGEIDVNFIGRDAFIRNKRAVGRAKDVADIEGLS